MHPKWKVSPLAVRLAGWYGFIFSGAFLLYGGVKVVLGILDNNYTDLAQPIAFAIIGFILITFAYGYRDLKAWGWYGLIVINGLVVLGSLVEYSRFESITLLVLSGAALVLLLTPTTRQYIAQHG